MLMHSPDCLTQAEDDHAERLERKERSRDEAAAALEAEYMAAATMPLLSTVAYPVTYGRRQPFLDAFESDLTCNRNRHLLARVVSILLRDEAGKATVRELAQQYADSWADELAGDDE